MQQAISLMESNMWAYMAYLPRLVNDANCLMKPNYWLMDGNVSDKTFNFITRANIAKETEIAEAIGYFDNKNLPFEWWISPSDKPNHLPLLLEKVTLHQTDSCTGLWLDLAHLSPLAHLPHFEIQKVTQQTQLQDFITVVSTTHLPAAAATYYNRAASHLLKPSCPAQLYVAYYQQEPVSALFLFLETHAKVAGIYSVATIPAYRKRGFASQLTQSVLAFARKNNYHFAALQASASGLSLYKRLGFEACCEVLAFGKKG